MAAAMATSHVDSMSTLEQSSAASRVWSQEPLRCHILTGVGRFNLSRFLTLNWATFHNVAAFRYWDLSIWTYRRPRGFLSMPAYMYDRGASDDRVAFYASKARSVDITIAVSNINIDRTIAIYPNCKEFNLFLGPMRVTLRCLDDGSGNIEMYVFALFYEPVQPDLSGFEAAFKAIAATGRTIRLRLFSFGGWIENFDARPLMGRMLALSRPKGDLDISHVTDLAMEGSLLDCPTLIVLGREMPELRKLACRLIAPDDEDDLDSALSCFPCVDQLKLVTIHDPDNTWRLAFSALLGTIYRSCPQVTRVGLPLDLSSSLRAPARDGLDLNFRDTAFPRLRELDIHFLFEGRRRLTAAEVNTELVDLISLECKVSVEFTPSRDSEGVGPYTARQLFRRDFRQIRGLVQNLGARTLGVSVIFPENSD